MRVESIGDTLSRPKRRLKDTVLTLLCNDAGHSGSAGTRNWLIDLRAVRFLGESGREGGERRKAWRARVKNHLVSQRSTKRRTAPCGEAIVLRNRERVSSMPQFFFPPRAARAIFFGLRRQRESKSI